ncbi:MAG: aldehyde dehydrogenase family protein [Acidimicrobiia bacterium]|nr:aldehyde dehydrogenase family protein [Acidimicrobiia bacterium]
MPATATSAPVSTEPATDVRMIAGVVAERRRAFAEGVTRPVPWRVEQLGRLHALLIENEAAIVDALAADLGRPRLEAWFADVGFVASEVDALRSRTPKLAAPRRVRTPVTNQPARSELIPEPLGTVLVIAPWNYPIQLLVIPLAGAIAAGNAAIVKPSELAPHTSALVARLVGEYLDPRAVAVVEGGVDETTELLRHRFEHIFYTGNGRVGRVVMRAAAEHLTPVTLELGGKSPAIVDGTAKLKVAARRIASGKFLNAGQTCIAPDYVLVERSVRDELVAELVEALGEFYGAEPRTNPDYGRIVNAHHLDRLRRMLDPARTVVGGDVDPDDRYLAPTILTDVPADHPCMQEEIFGPILPVLDVDDLDAAIAHVNAGDKPLALYVFTEDDGAADRVLAETSSGGAMVNGTIFHIANPHLPFGGVGESGMGAYHGDASFETFTHFKSVLRRTTRLDPPITYPPYTKRKLRLLKRFF